MNNPYPGARPLNMDDRSGLLIGRDDDLHIFSRLVRQCSVVALMGPSGVGKSSLVGAGFAGRLNEDSDLVVRVFSSWSLIPDLPGVAWYAAALEATLRSSTASDPRMERLLERLGPAKEDPQGFIDGVQNEFGSHLVVIFDQLEELLRADPSLGHLFLENIRGVAGRYPNGFAQVISMRQEYASHLRVIEQHLDKSLWEEYFVTQIASDYIPSLVTVPLALDGNGVQVEERLTTKLKEVWTMARPAAARSSAVDAIDESQVGLLHFQAFLSVMWEDIRPAPGVLITNDEVLSKVGVEWPGGDWPIDAAGARRFFDSSLRRYVTQVLANKVADFCEVADKNERSSAQLRANETLRIAAELPEHLSSAGFKIVQSTDELAAIVLHQLEELHWVPEEGFPGAVPPSFGVGSDPGQATLPLALELGALCREGFAEDPIGLMEELEHRYPGLTAWGDTEIPAGRLNGASPLLTACELIVAYERALTWLNECSIIRLTNSRTPVGMKRLAAIVHDGFGSALLKWAVDTMAVPAIAVSIPTAVKGDVVISRPNVTDDTEALEQQDLGITEWLGWVGCSVRAFFDGVTFRNCDLRSTLFVGCRFRNVVFEDCLTYGLLFIDCVFEGGMIIRSSGSTSARPGSQELKTLTFGTSCQSVDGELVIEGFEGYGLFLDGMSGPWRVERCRFSHMDVTDPDGDQPTGALVGPGRIVRSPELRHVAVVGSNVAPIEVVGPQLPAFFDADDILVTVHEST